jgi:hypothetical protein
MVRYNKALQRTGISVPLIDNLPHNAVVSRPLKASVMPLLYAELNDPE